MERLLVGSNNGLVGHSVDAGDSTRVFEGPPVANIRRRESPFIAITAR